MVVYKIAWMSDFDLYNNTKQWNMFSWPWDLAELKGWSWKLSNLSF
jgi:hypothetical protein